MDKKENKKRMMDFTVKVLMGFTGLKKGKSLTFKMQFGEVDDEEYIKGEWEVRRIN